MKNILRKLLFKYCFTDHEKTTIINALFRRHTDASTQKVNGDYEVRETCHKLAMEIFNY